MDIVHLIDDDPAVRKALALLLETVGLKVFSFEGPMSFLAQLPHLGAGVVVLDMRMPVMSGLKLQEELRSRNIAWPTVLITGHGDIDACRRAFRNGAVDFLTKPVDEQDLIEAIQRGQEVLSEISQRNAEHSEFRLLLDRLTPRERDVLALISKGLATKDIALALELSPRTVESHRSSICAKIETTSVVELTRVWNAAGAATP
ncbi:response regulator [Devosia sp. BK]|uniref:response regulator transcription factor n=1 Tax=unclassified Devosia TaxID=196773 RepID=UPI000A944D9F|nr:MULTISPECIES: response regulator [unclassified Devosia]MDV3253255.1 response regulator [Devosia sp. BK]